MELKSKIANYSYTAQSLIKHVESVIACFKSDQICSESNFRELMKTVPLTNFDLYWKATIKFGAATTHNNFDLTTTFTNGIETLTLVLKCKYLYPSAAKRLGLTRFFNINSIDRWIYVQNLL